MSPKNKQSLGELVEILSGFAFDSNEFADSGEMPIVRIRDIIPGYSSTFYNGDYDPKYVIQDGDILIGMDGEFNRARWRGGKALLNQRVCRISVSSQNLDEGYLFYFLPNALKAIEDATPFVTVKHLSVKSIRDIEIPLPPLPEQKRIADILDRAEALRAKRRAALAQLDDLTQSIFIEMFGDPAINPKGWPLKPLGELASKFSDGPFGSNIKSSHYTEKGIRVIRLQNIGVGEFLDDDKAYVSEEHFIELKKHECLPGDVIVGTLGCPNLRAFIQPKWLNVAINKADCIQFRPDERIVNAPYICSLLNQPATEKMARDLMLGQTRLRISMGRLKGLEVPLPPLSLQQEFSLRIAAVEKLKATHKASMAKLDELFASLQHRAFRGEL